MFLITVESFNALYTLPPKELNPALTDEVMPFFKSLASDGHFFSKVYTSSAYTFDGIIAVRYGRVGTANDYDMIASAAIAHANATTIPMTSSSPASPSTSSPACDTASLPSSTRCSWRRRRPSSTTSCGSRTAMAARAPALRDPSGLRVPH